ncbi:MAG: hypothetical protein JSS93_08700 [Bacteroidetes bacterium]|nr:hypothetical protein [Bacteroidota bacterium]
MQTSSLGIYQQSLDQQRILVLGKNRTRILQIILFVLKYNNRKYSVSSPAAERFDDSPIMIIEPGDTNALSAYQHHILIFSELPLADKLLYSTLADETPKSGSIIFDETDPVSSEIAKKQRPDVAASGYTALKSELQQSKVVLISSTNEKYTTRLGIEDLKNLGAVKDIAKKIGISSGQFYRAIAAFQ